MNHSPNISPVMARRLSGVRYCLVLFTLLSAVAGCKKQVTVPDVKQLTLDQGRQTLTTAGLTTGKITCSQGNALPLAKVLVQSPSAGTSVAPGTAIDLGVDSAVLVPDLHGSSAADSLITLQNAGLKAALQKKPTYDIFHAGKVLAQDVPAQTAMARDSVITLTVASPPDVAAFAPIIEQQLANQHLTPTQRSLLQDLSKQ